MSKKLAPGSQKLDIQHIDVNIDLSIKDLSSLYTRIRDAQMKSMNRAIKSGRVPEGARVSLTPMKLSAIKKSQAYKGASDYYKKVLISNEIKRMQESNAQTQHIKPKTGEKIIHVVDSINFLGGMIGINEKNPAETLHNLTVRFKGAYDLAYDRYHKGRYNGYGQNVQEYTEEEIMQKVEDYTARQLAPKASTDQRKAIIKRLKGLGFFR